MDAIDCLKTRRSIRRFKDNPVKDEDLKTMLECARLAPSGTNMQNWHFVIIKNRDLIQRMQQEVEREIKEIVEREHSLAKEKVARFARFFTFFPDAPVLIAVLIEPKEVFLKEIGRKCRYDSLKNSVFSTAAEEWLQQWKTCYWQRMLLATVDVG